MQMKAHMYKLKSTGIDKVKYQQIYTYSVIFLKKDNYIAK